MSRIKSFSTSFILLFAIFATSFAQSAAERIDYKPSPYMFVGLQGGAQTTFGELSPFKLITPTGSLSFGAFFTPSVGARIHFNGMWNKGGFEIGNDDYTYNYKYATTDLDLLLNLCTLFGREDYYPLNVYLIGGIGLSYAWDNDDLTGGGHSSPYAWKDNLLSHNLRLGAMLDYNLSKHWSINLEVSANSLSDHYNSLHHSADDWQLTAQVGLAYKFGFSKRVHTAPVVVAPVEEFVDDKDAESAAAALVVSTPEKKPEKKPEVKPLETVQKDIFFAIASSEIRKSEAAKIKEVVKWLEEHPTAVATITGHADAGTGNPTLNAKYARSRAEIVAKAITDAGIDASRLTVESKGDKVMPYGDNENSRVAIIIGAEK